MSDLMYKATDKAAWDAYAASANLTADGMPADGIYIDEIGPIATTPAVLDEDGEIVTPAVVDESHHVNVRVMRPAVPSVDIDGNPVIDGYDMAALAQGGPGVEWIDPATVSSPSRIWAGGMSYYTPGPIEGA